MIETKPRIAAVDSCFELVGSRQHGAATTAVWKETLYISLYFTAF